MKLYEYVSILEAIIVSYYLIESQAKLQIELFNFLII